MFSKNALAGSKVACSHLQVSNTSQSRPFEQLSRAPPPPPPPPQLLKRKAGAYE